MFVFCSLFTFSVTDRIMDSKMNAKLVMCCVLFFPPILFLSLWYLTGRDVTASQ